MIRSCCTVIGAIVLILFVAIPILIAFPMLAIGVGAGLIIGWLWNRKEVNP